MVEGEDGVVPGPARARYGGRRAVAELLDAGTRRRVCLVIGAAGWGKTTAVSSWAARSRSASVRCAADDPAAARLLADLHAAVRPHLPVPALATGPLGRAGEFRPEVGALCRWLGDHLAENLVLVVDDVQELRPDGDATRLVEGVCRQAPDRLHVVLVSRQEPPFPLRRGQGLVAEIAAPELALHVTDVAGSLESALGDTRPALAVGVWERTGGWPALVDLAVERLRGIEPADRMTALGYLTAPGERLHDYLAKEVVGQEPESVQELLRRLAVYGETGSGTGFDDEAVLADLSRRGLVQCIHRDPVRWSLVRPLRDYFGHEAALPAGHLGDRSPAAARERSRRPGQDGLVGDGQVGDVALAWQMARTAFRQGRFDEARAVRRRTPLADEKPADAVRMLTLEAATCRATGNLAGTRVATIQALAAAHRCDEPRAWATVHAVLGLQAGAEGDRRRAEEHWSDALGDATAADDALLTALIQAFRATHLLEFGWPRRAFAEAQTSLHTGERRGDLFLIAHSLTTMGRARTRLAELPPAISDLARAAELFQQIGSRFVSWPLCGLADVHRMRGQLARARAVYEEALGLAEQGHDVLGTSAALTGLARVRAADDAAAATALAERAVALRDGLREVPAVLTRGWVALWAGDRQTAASHAARAGSAARQRRDEPGLAEALVLGALSSEDPRSDGALFAEAIEIWHEAGCLVDEAIARVLTARVGAALADLGDDLAHQLLRKLGIDVTGRSAGPLGAVRQRGPSVSIRTMGAFEVFRDGVRIPKAAWQSRKARDLLKLLVAHRRPVHREQLMELLWPDTGGARSGNRLSVVLSMVRDVLQPERGGHEPLATDGSSVWLDRLQVTIDVEEFLTQADLALDAHRRAARDATARLVAAEAIHTGEFLGDDPYQEWAQALAEEVRATHVALLRALTRRLREAGDIDGVVRHSLRLLAYDSYDEQAHFDLVMVHLEAGHFGEARRRYRLYAKRMREMRIVPQPMPNLGRRPEQRADGLRDPG